MSELSLTEPWLVADGLSRRYRNGRGVGPVSLQVRPGEVQALVGPNGSGKTTLLRCLATRTRPGTGTVAWFGQHNREQARSRLGVVFDATAHADELSARQNLAFFGTARKAARDLWEPALEAAAVAELGSEPVSRLSYGMRRRVLLAEALVGDPALLLLDEPTLGLDVSGCQWLAEALHARAQLGLATCISTNDTDFVEQVATRVCFLVDGEAVRDAPLAALLAELGGTREIQLSYRGSSPINSVRAVTGVERAAEVEGGLLILGRQRDGLIPAILATLGDLDLHLVDLKVRDPGLADCFLQLTGRALHD
ncbi:MAG TPA: ABC transporter ATP-binding protein [Candidatus Saccharimonadales bacterium]|nr:ABC transporter ATP-binding protein [Candidatus Saccharimonadales bacterium]